MGSLIAALLVALWLPTAPAMAAALLNTNDEVSGLLLPAGQGTPRQHPRPTARATEIHRLTRLSVVLLAAACAHQQGDLRCCLPWTSFGVVDEPLLERSPAGCQRWNNTADRREDVEPPGLTGGLGSGCAAGLVALPPPMR